MKKKIIGLLVCVVILISLFILPTNYNKDIELTGESELAFNPPCKLPKLPPQE